MIMSGWEPTREGDGRQSTFAPGRLIRHRRYGYRGVVVSVDPECLADEAWYRSNRTQPDRNQPWYHVLVDGSAATTYAAASSLEPDGLLTPVRHPMVALYFDGFRNGAHVRNHRPWS